MEAVVLFLSRHAWGVVYRCILLRLDKFLGHRKIFEGLGAGDWGLGIWGLEMRERRGEMMSDEGGERGEKTSWLFISPQLALGATVNGAFLRWRFFRFSHPLCFGHEKGLGPEFCGCRRSGTLPVVGYRPRDSRNSGRGAEGEQEWLLHRVQHQEDRSFVRSERHGT
jgi:hypothetical protein